MQTVDKIKQLDAMDRAVLAAVFERQAKKLIDEELRPKLADLFKAIANEARTNHRPPAPPSQPPSSSGGDAGDLPRRVGRLEEKTDKMTEDLGAIQVQLGRVEERQMHAATKADLNEGLAPIKTSISQMTERLTHMPTNAKMYVAGGAALATVLGVMAKGFGWL